MNNLIDDKYFHEPQKFYAATSKDSENISFASSGGVFFEIAKLVINQGGVVFGSVLNYNRCYHVSAESIDGLRKMQGSKYVRSSIGHTYKQCFKLLMENRLVLFSGTPCQIASLYAFLKNKNIVEKLDNLLTVDLFCHGTPSQKLFKLYFRWLEDKYHAYDGIHQFIFRANDVSWDSEKIFSFVYKKNNKDYLVKCRSGLDPYYVAFLEGSSLLHQCYACNFARKERVGDISIGDFWGIENRHPGFYNLHHHSGISAVMVNTDKGQDFFNQVKHKFYIEESNYSAMRQCSIDSSDTSISNCKKIHKDKRNALKLAIRNDDYNEIFNHILKVKRSPMLTFKKLISSLFPTPVKNLLKHILGR